MRNDREAEGVTRGVTAEEVTLDQIIGLTRQQIQERALRLLDRVRKCSVREEDLVELKSAWPTPPAKVARRLAAMANASRGVPFFWLIGIDESGVTQPIENQLDEWWPSVSSRFEEVAPRLTTISTEGIYALYFEPVDTPYLVRNPGFGVGGDIAEFDIPWREATTTRSATRAQLLRILVPKSAQPLIEIRDARVSVGPSTLSPDSLTLGAYARLYLIPASRERVVMPLHLMQVRLWIAEQEIQTKLSARYTGTSDQGSLVIQTDRELILDGPGEAEINFSVQTAQFDFRSVPSLRMDLVLVSASAEPHEAVISAELAEAATSDAGKAWELRPAG